MRTEPDRLVSRLRSGVTLPCVKSQSQSKKWAQTPQVKEELKKAGDEVVSLRLQLKKQAEEADAKLVAAMSMGAARHHDVERLREKLADTQAALEAEAAEHKFDPSQHLSWFPGCSGKCGSTRETVGSYAFSCWWELLHVHLLLTFFPPFWCTRGTRPSFPHFIVIFLSLFFSPLFFFSLVQW